MSWFSELTSKAEAMLVKLDQDTAQALQNSPQILARSLVFDGTRNYVDQNRDGDTENNRTSNDHESHLDDRPISNAENGIQNESMKKSDNLERNNANANANAGQLSNGDCRQDAINHDMIHLDEFRENTPERNARDEKVAKLDTFTIESPNLSRKFKLQTSKLRPTLHKNEDVKTSASHANGYNRPSKFDSALVNLGADDIRASINKSLQEYSQSSSRDRLREEQLEQTSYSPHFDDQSNLINHSMMDGRDQSGRIHSSLSFSIEVPDDSDHSTNITSQILKQSLLRKKSSFNLHKIINKLASQRDHSQSLLRDKTRIKLRRVQMRVASYLRRLNYYFQAYPTMKYWMIGYLVILQLLVVYVLFFYQSSSSSSYLANQVKQQQRELAESLQHSNSEKVHPYSSDQNINRFR